MFKQYPKTSLIEVNNDTQIKDCRFNFISNAISETLLREDTNDSSESIIAGRQSEEFAFKILNEKYKKVFWVNCNDESGAPYDFKIYDDNSSLFYIDCKGFSDSPTVYLTPNEWKFYSTYHIAYKFIVNRIAIPISEQLLQKFI